MKLKAIFAALFVAGLLASIALASPSSDGSGTTTSASTGTTTGKHGEHGKKNEHGKKDDDEDENEDAKPKCRNVELKGTVAGGSLSVAVTKANKGGRDLVGQSASLSFSGKVSVKARMCAAEGASTSTLQLRVLKVESHPAPTTTTTTTTTSTTTTTTTP